MRRVGEYPLWIGNARDARDIRAVLDAGIEAVVDLAMEEPPVRPTRELVYLRFPSIDGDENSSGLLRRTVGAVVELVRSGVPTLVACGAGMSRAPAIVATAVAAVEGHPAETVLERVRAGGPADVSPALWSALRLALRPNGATDNSQG